MKTAIVTTLINAASVLDYFINYHLAIGFDYIFLFFDDPNDAAISMAEKYPQVIIIRNDLLLKERWENTRLLKLNSAYGSYIQKETMARQLLNVEVANDLSLEMGIAWLLHIDIDELFYSPELSVREHFQLLNDQGHQFVTYANHEAIPEAIDIDNYLREVTLFKRNVSCLTPNQVDVLNQQIQLEGKSGFFLYYSIGKSAVRVSETLVPFTVHSFSENNSKYFNSPAILHFPVCGFGHFYQKYETLGPFEDYWFGVVDIENNIPFHIQSRDELGKRDQSSALAFYKRRVMADEKNVNEWIDKGLFFRVDLTSLFVI